MVDQSDKNEFFAALQGLGNSMKQYGISQAINNANQQAQAIKNDMRPDVEKRRMISGVADDIFMRIVSAGGDVQQAAMLKQSMMPPTASSVEQAMMSGDPFLQDIGRQMMDEEQMRKMKEMQEQARLQERTQINVQNNKGKNDMQAEMLKASLTTGGNPTLTADQANSTQFAAMMSQAENNFTRLKAQGVDGSNIRTGLSTLLPNIVSPATTQRLEQVQRQFIQAVLRKQSGAAISAAEFETEQPKYFPVAGDSKVTVQQKSEARRLALEGLKISSGAGWDSIQSRIPGAGRSPEKDGFSDVKAFKAKMPGKSYIRD